MRPLQSCLVPYIEGVILDAIWGKSNHKSKCNTILQKNTGMKPCNSKRCTICRHVNKNKTIHVNSKPIRLHANGNCNTNVAIYLLGCRQCPELGYAGQTINTLNCRWVQNRLPSHISHLPVPMHDQVGIFMGICWPKLFLKKLINKNDLIQMPLFPEPQP